MTEPSAVPDDQLAALIHVDGTVELIPFELGMPSRDQLHLMYDRLGCSYVQAVTLDPITAIVPDLQFATIWMDEEGKFDPKPLNPLATWLCREMYQSISRDDWIAGPALITGGVDEEGETLPMDPETAKLLRDVADVIEKTEDHRRRWSE
jgi:hypothetical protein